MRPGLRTWDPSSMDDTMLLRRGIELSCEFVELVGLVAEPPNELVEHSGGDLSASCSSLTAAISTVSVFPALEAGMKSCKRTFLRDCIASVPDDSTCVRDTD
mmetsp:Transcript_539/g.1414  ORF Transcript_539/g.1414 Transcript_539/m.1414 type:complete len:102 (-) Transcript_539:709-1014(-)